jgi:predicted methyltransferase
MRLFSNCTEENKDEHFLRIDNYMNNTIPILEYFLEHKDFLKENHKVLIPKLFDHFNYYRLDEQKLKQRCSELLVLEECCEEIYLLETMFYEEIKTWNTEELN